MLLSTFIFWSASALHWNKWTNEKSRGVSFKGSLQFHDKKRSKQNLAPFFTFTLVKIDWSPWRKKNQTDWLLGMDSLTLLPSKVPY